MDTNSSRWSKIKFFIGRSLPGDIETSRDASPELQKFRSQGLELRNHGMSVKIFPRFEGFMVDDFGGYQSKSAIFWHGEKDTRILRKIWKVQDDNTVYPKCETTDYIFDPVLEFYTI